MNTTLAALAIAFNAEFETLNPSINSMMTGVMVQDAVLRPLIKLSPSGTPEPVLLKEIPTTKNKKVVFIDSPNGKQLKIDIEFLEKAKWGDGTDVTCKDLQTAWLIGKEPTTSTPNKDDYTNILNIDIDNKKPKKCSVLFANAYFNYYLNLPRPMPTHLELPIFEKFKDKAQAYERNSLYTTAPNNPGLYNGPFTVSEFKLGSHLILKPNSYFYGSQPHLQKVVIKFILNSAAIEANLLSKNVDMISSAGLTFDQALQFEKRIQNQNLPYKIDFVPGTMYSHIEVNLDHPILKDIKVRHALAYGFSKDELTKSFFEGRQPTAKHFATQFDEWFTNNSKDFIDYRYSPLKAAKLLDEAGWRLADKTENGQRFRYKNNQKLSLVLSGLTDNKLNETLAVYLQNHWRKLGIDITIKNYPARVYFSEFLKKRQFELAFLTWVNPPNVVSHNVMSSKAIPTESNSWAGNNRAGWKNQNVDSWLEQASQEFDSQKRISIMQKILHAYTEDLPSIPMYYRSNNSVIPKNLSGYRLSGHNYTEFLEIENWQLK